MLDIWKNMFDRIYVVSLPASSERREYVYEHLNANGICDFEWHDAFDPKHPKVMQVYDQGLVHQYPPCFRCGKTECGRKDCNNVLLPVQVAVFMTYMDLWKKIAARGECALVFEDDVLLHQSWRIVLPSLKEEIDLGSVPFHAQTPCLLRMGWALGSDHDEPGPIRIESTVRNSNPCFAVTSAYAAKAVSHFKKVDHTADVYFHMQLPEAGQAFTVFPPIASELSWSTGQVPSLIHPKDINADYLETQGDHEGATRARAKIQAHLKHMYHRKFLITGHPRTGTGYLASLLRQLDFDVGHEKTGSDGLSSWMFAADSDGYPYAQDDIAASRRSLHWEVLLHVVRDPATAVAAIMRDNVWAPPSYQFRRDAIAKQMDVDLDAYAENFERAVMSLVCWSRMILEMQPDCWVRVEDAHETLPRFLASRGLIDANKTFDLLTKSVNADKFYQGIQRPKPEIGSADWATLSTETMEGLKWYCNRFGYSLPGKSGFGSSASDASTTKTLDPLKRQFLTPSGWERSLQEQRPVRADGRALPWFTYGAIEFLDRVVDGGMRVFEYGAGYSTLWWQRTALVHSVDHDPDWVQELGPKLEANAVLTLLEQGAPADLSAQAYLGKYHKRPRRTTWDYEPDRIVRRGLEDDSFLAYAAHVRKSRLDYDVIIIDGMARRLCTEFAVNCLTERGFIILDNSNRSDYDAAFDILSEAGFFQIPFWGLVPGANFLTCTSIFARNTDFLPDAQFRPNSFGLPEY